LNALADICVEQHYQWDK